MPFDLTIDEAFITCNVGISFAVDGLGTAESLIADADLAMFRAKEKGGNRFEIFDTDMRAWINERRKTEVALRHALDREEFELHYQPIVSVAGGGLKGFEALVRWNRGTLGMVPPGDFIPVAEDSGLIIPMGEWILDEACRQIADWQRLHGDQGLSDLGEPLRSPAGAAQHRRHGRPQPGRVGRAPVGPHRRDHRDGPARRRRSGGAHARRAEGHRGAARRSTTSAPATRRSRTCAGSRSTS